MMFGEGIVRLFLTFIGFMALYRLAGGVFPNFHYGLERY